MKKLYKFLLLSLFIVLISSLTGCDVKREDGVKELFTAINKCDMDTMNKFFGDDSKLTNFDYNFQEEVVKTVYKNTTYKILSTNKDIVEVEITTPNGIALFSMADNMRMEAQIKGQQEMSDFPEQLGKMVNKEDFPKVTTKVKIKINNKSGKWIIEKNQELESVISGNLI